MPFFWILGSDLIIVPFIKCIISWKNINKLVVFVGTWNLSFKKLSNMKFQKMKTLTGLHSNFIGLQIFNVHNKLSIIWHTWLISPLNLYSTLFMCFLVHFQVTIWKLWYHKQRKMMTQRRIIKKKMLVYWRITSRDWMKK